MRKERKSQAVISMEEKLKQWREAKSKKDIQAIEKAAASRSSQESNASSSGSTTGSIDSGDRSQNTRGRGRSRDEKTLRRSSSQKIHPKNDSKSLSIQSGGSVDSIDKNAGSGQTKLLASAFDPSYTVHTKSSAMKDKVPDKKRRTRSRSRQRAKELAQSTRQSTIHIVLDAEEDSNTKENPGAAPNSTEEEETRDAPPERMRTIAFSVSTDERDAPSDDKKHVKEVTKKVTAEKTEAKENEGHHAHNNGQKEEEETRDGPPERKRTIAFSASTDERDTPSDDTKHVKEATKKVTAEKTEAKENEGHAHNNGQKEEEETREEHQERQRTIAFSASTDERDTPSDDKKLVKEATKKATAEKTEAKENEGSEGKYNKNPQSSDSDKRAANPFQQIDSDTNAWKGQNSDTHKTRVSPLSPQKHEPTVLSPKKQNPVKDIETDPIPKSTESDTSDLVDAVFTSKILTEENDTSSPLTVLEHFESFARNTKEYVRSPTPTVRSPTPMVRSPSPSSEDDIRTGFISRRERLRNRRRRQSFSESGPLSPRSFSLLDEEDDEEEEDETPTVVKLLDDTVPIPTMTIRMAEIEVEEEGIETIQYQDSTSSDENDEIEVDEEGIETIKYQDNSIISDENDNRQDAESSDENIKAVDPDIMLSDNNIQSQPQMDNVTEAHSQHDYDRLAAICRMYRDGHKQVRGLNGILKAEKSDAEERLRMLSGAYEMKLKQFNKMSSELTAIRRENSILQGRGGNDQNMHKLIFDLKRQMMTGLSAAVERNKKLEAQLNQARGAVTELKSRLPPDEDWVQDGAFEI
eukprot:scaffold26556_cov46-Attheya_sp.AAC.1